MKRYVVRRLLMAIPLLLAISFVCFCFINLIPSNPAEVALRVQQTPVITDEIIDREELKKKAEARARMEQRLQEMAENEDAAESEIVMEAPAEESGEVVEAEVKEAE